MGLRYGGPGPSSDRTLTDSWVIMIKERPWISVLFPISPLCLPFALSLLKLSNHCHTPFPSLSFSLTHTLSFTLRHQTLKNKRTEPGLWNMSRSLLWCCDLLCCVSVRNVPSKLQHSMLDQVKPLSIWELWPFEMQYFLCLLHHLRTNKKRQEEH